MNRITPLALIALVGIVTSPVHATAQPDQLISRGVDAYEELDFERAVGLMRRTVDEYSEEYVGDANMIRALSYLGAAELMLERTDSTDAVFTRLVLRAPRYRLDDRIFPPVILERYDDIRRRTRAIALVPQGDTTLLVGRERFTAWLYPSTVHDIHAFVGDANGEIVRTLFHGTIGDSLDIGWDGEDARGQTPGDGVLYVRVVSHAPGHRTLREVQVPIGYTVLIPDTLTHTLRPADHLMLPERQTLQLPLRSIATGTVLASFAAVGPSVVSGSSPSSSRLVVSGAALAAGVIGFLSNKPGRTLDDNVAANRALLASWRQDVRRTTTENRRRLSNLRFRVRPGSIARIEPEH